ncbi:hypothetical protein GCM10010486_44840 [Nonomuraea roseoviolacea subsp. carminata]
MAARRDDKSPTPAPASAPAAPPYYIAAAPLFIGKFGRAHNVGDLVPVEHVEQYGWRDKVRLPDGYEAADQTQSEPETENGQATTTGKGDA